MRSFPRAFVAALGNGGRGRGHLPRLILSSGVHAAPEASQNSPRGITPRTAVAVGRLPRPNKRSDGKVMRPVASFQRTGTMTDEFDPNWPYGHVTRNGCKARILATDLKGKSPIAAAIEDRDLNEWVGLFKKNGQAGHYKDEYDLLNAPVPKRKFVKWLNVYEHDEAYFHNTKEEANSRKKPKRLACIKVEFEEGEGL